MQTGGMQVHNTIAGEHVVGNERVNYLLCHICVKCLRNIFGIALL